MIRDLAPASGTGARRRVLGEQSAGHELLASLGKVLPGLALAAGLGAAATVVADWVGVGWLGYEKTPVSPILLTVLLGLVIRNTVGLPGVYDPGLRVCVCQLLRLGVALLGIRLSLVSAGMTGLIALPVVVVCIATALLVISGLTRLLGLPRRLGTLIAVGTSICGITAIVATSPVIDADEDETSYAVATIALFGMITLFAYPFLAHLVFGDATQAGMFLGTAIHDTSQVAGAGLTYEQQFGSPRALDTAVVTKLVRNLCMIGVIPLMGVLYHRRGGDGSKDSGAPFTLRRLVPLFIVGFLAMTALRTIGDLGERPFGLLSRESWAWMVNGFQQVAELALLLAMAAVGLGTSLRRLRALGMRPLSVGLAAAVCVGLVSYALIRLLVALHVV
jgi:uncharacterized integral membrane protein (TIGR00698 family)